MIRFVRGGRYSIYLDVSDGEHQNAKALFLEVIQSGEACTDVLIDTGIFRRRQSELHSGRLVLGIDEDDVARLDADTLTLALDADVWSCAVETIDDYIAGRKVSPELCEIDVGPKGKHIDLLLKL